MASTEDQSDPTTAVVGAPEPQASDASDAPAGAATRAARPRRSRAKAAAPQAQAEPSDVTSAAGQPSDVAAGADAGAPADGAAADAGPAPAKKVARRSRKAAAAPVAAPAAADAAATDGDAPDGSAQAALAVQTAPAADPIVAAPRKRASRRVAAPTATPESADGTASADGAAPTDGAPAGEVAASADEVAGGAAPAAATTRTPRKRAPRKTAASAAAATAAPAPIAETGDPALDEEAAAAAAEAEAAEEATRAATVPSFGLLFQAPVVVTPRRRATRPSGTPALPVAAADAGAQDTLVLADELEADDIEVGAADADVLTDTDADDAVDDATSPAARRRRRRGGKGRRGRLTDGPSTAGEGAAAAPAPAAGDAPDTATASGSADGSGDEGDGDTDVRSDLASRRRTRRRRRGSSAGEVEDAPGVVTRVREVRSARDEVVGVRGSTRLEAKKQRRREGREAGRRRQVITEAEFLARRESVERVMVVRAKEGRTQIGVLEDNVLVEHYVSRETNASMAGNIYLGKVQNVLPSMEAAFVDIGRGRNAVLYAGEVNWDAAGMEAGASKRIENALESGQSVLVQVTKDPIGHKGARLTSQISLPGRYLVYVPDSSMTGISRKLPDTERARLKRILRDVVPESAGVIVRTAAEGASEEELRADVERLTAIWEQIKAKAEAPAAARRARATRPSSCTASPTSRCASSGTCSTRTSPR
jgi:ribonuclease E